jgi:RNA polymerase sigma-70 factor (ECF subfamily)
MHRFRCLSQEIVTTDPTDAQLVALTLAGDPRGFEMLVRRYRRVALARATALVIDPSDAEDVVQDAFIRAHDQLAVLREPDRVGPWLMTMVRNLALNSARARRRQRTVPVEVDVQADARHSADQLTLQRDLRTTLMRALAQLSTIQREVVLLADLEGCAHAEIARLLGLSVLMSRRHLSDARSRLRVILSQQDR